MPGGKRWADMTPEQKEKQREANRRWQQRNPDKVAAANRRWREKNPEKWAQVKHESWKRYYAKNREYLIASASAYARKRRKNDPEFVAKQRQWHRDWKETPEGKAWWKRYRNRPDVRAKQREANKFWYRTNKHKVKAHVAVREALKKGLLKKLPCEQCRATKVEAHHDDYTKPLEVRWLCRQCHVQIHPRKKTW